MKTKRRRKHTMVRLPIVMPAPLDRAIRLEALDRREYPSKTAGRILARGLGLDLVALGFEPATNGDQHPSNSTE